MTKETEKTNGDNNGDNKANNTPNNPLNPLFRFVFFVVLIYLIMSLVGNGGQPLSPSDFATIIMNKVLSFVQFFTSSGSWAMMGALGFLIFIHEFGHWFVARKLNYAVPIFSIGFPFTKRPRLRLGSFWGTQFEITPWLLGGYVAINPEDDDFKKSAIWKRMSVMVAGVTMNILFAFVGMSLLLATVGKAVPVYDSVSIRDLNPASANAKNAGLLKDDQIVSVEQKTIKSPEDLISELAKNKSKTVSVTVLRNNQTLNLSVPVDGDGRIGIMLGIKAHMEYEHLGVFQAIKISGQQTLNMFVALPYQIAIMTGLAPLPAGLPPQAADVHGIVAIVQIGASAFNYGLYGFMMTVFSISLNLAVVNILPIPLLDGGHLLFLLIEKIRGKPVDKQTQEKISLVFLFLLGALMLFGLYNDVVKPFPVD